MAGMSAARVRSSQPLCSVIVGECQLHQSRESAADGGSADGGLCVDAAEWVRSSQPLWTITTAAATRQLHQSRGSAADGGSADSAWYVGGVSEEQSASVLISCCRNTAAASESRVSSRRISADSGLCVGVAE